MAPAWSHMLTLALLAIAALVVLAGAALVLWLFLRRKRTPRGFEVMPPK
jgi:hypothetical protein